MPIILDAPTVGTIMDAASTVFTEIIGNVATVGTTIVSDPVILTFTVIGIGSLALGWFKSLLRG